MASHTVSCHQSGVCMPFSTHTIINFHLHFIRQPLFQRHSEYEPNFSTFISHSQYLKNGFGILLLVLGGVVAFVVKTAVGQQAVSEMVEYHTFSKSHYTLQGHNIVLAGMVMQLGD